MNNTIDDDSDATVLLSAQRPKKKQSVPARQRMSDIDDVSEASYSGDDSDGEADSLAEISEASDEHVNLATDGNSGFSIGKLTLPKFKWKQLRI